MQPVGQFTHAIRIYVYRKRRQDVFAVQAPSYRFDIAREEDLIEEIARLYGYDKIPRHCTPNAAFSDASHHSESMLWNKLQACADALQLAQGYQEVDYLQLCRRKRGNEICWVIRTPIRLKNPIASNYECDAQWLMGWAYWMC